MNFLKKNGAGLLLCLAISIPAWFLGKSFPVIGGPVFAILIGMVLTLILKEKEPFTAGINYTSKKILQAAVIFLGFGMNLSQILAGGKQSLPIIISTITTSLIIAFILYKALKLKTNNAILVGVGSSICGGSAIAATAPVIDATDEEVAQSISVIFLFNVLAALIFPTLGAVLGLSNEGFGLFAGTAINDTSSVTAAAATASGLAGAAQTGLPGRRQASSRPMAAAPAAAHPGRRRCFFSCSNLIPPPDGQADCRGHPVSGGQHRPPFPSMDRLCRRQTRGSLPPFPCETLETLPNCGRPGSHRKKSEILKFFQTEGRTPPTQTGCR